MQVPLRGCIESIHRAGHRYRQLEMEFSMVRYTVSSKINDLQLSPVRIHPIFSSLPSVRFQQFHQLSGRPIICLPRFSMIREYASRPLQGYALHHETLYRAMASQTLEDENMCRVSVLEFANDGSRSKTMHRYTEFKMYLDEHAQNLSQDCRRLFILEDLPVRFVCLFGSRLRIHPTVFARHYSSDLGDDNSTISDDLTSFPSKTKANTVDGFEYESEGEDGEEARSVGRRFTLRYRAVMPPVSAKQHPNPAICPPWLEPSDRHGDWSA